MKIEIQNKSGLPRKMLRFVKWKMYKLRPKFKKLISVTLHVDIEGTQPKVYHGTVRLGMKGTDILIKQKAEDPMLLFQNIYKTAHVKLAESHRRKL